MYERGRQDRESSESRVSDSKNSKTRFQSTSDTNKSGFQKMLILKVCPIMSKKPKTDRGGDRWIQDRMSKYQIEGIDGYKIECPNIR